jgi:Uma2 family endonuclease
MSSIQEKIEDYLTFGVENIWIVDPSRKKAFWADADGIHPAAEGILLAPPVQMNLAAMWPEDALS